MFYEVECMRLTIYDLSTSLLGNMKQQLTDYKLGRTRNFGFVSILSTLFFERVLGLIPRVPIASHGHWDIAQLCWEGVMQHLGGGRVSIPYPPDFFHYWRRQIIAIDDYPYAGIEFCGDLDMPIP